MLVGSQNEHLVHVRLYKICQAVSWGTNNGIEIYGC